MKEELKRLRTLSDQYVSTQRVLFAAENRLRAVEQGADETPGIPESTKDPYCESVRASLEVLSNEMELFIPFHPAYEFMMGIPGINRTMACKIGGLIPMDTPEDFANFGQLRKFAGFAPGSDRLIKGELAPFNMTLKVAVFVMGDRLKKAAGICRKHPNDYHPKRLYREIYENWRLTYANRHGIGPKGFDYFEKYKIVSNFRGYDEFHPIPKGKKVAQPVWSDGRQDKASLRKMYDVFLYHVWKVWRVNLGWPVQRPFPIEKQGHQTYFPESEFSSPAMAVIKIKKHKKVKSTDELVEV